ncbi:hypothetical protein HanOQP8_Chr07g0266131 [Helianthus annuus]|nr:hypothetical protein HanLR1_Chr07g0259211 [Helianthus annuus]KAJ0732702.1 hypothetical protein HanOQP8_Chr07g0266131 [Helianthus annuus]KAJ0906361.1 hypothetical protein HanPSC8_Chr07g0304611 [Helianthus annuus]
MAMSMHYQLINTFCLKKDTNKKPNPKQQTQFTQLSFPKSSPTQLLTHQNPSTQTKLEALTNVVQDLETSVKNGINIDDPRIFSSLLETCYRLQAIELGIRIHRVIPTKLLRRNAGVSSKLLSVGLAPLITHTYV